MTDAASNAGLTYLASPYSHPSAAMRAWRFDQAVAHAARLMVDGENVFSPIAHSHPIDLALPAPQNHGFWLKQDFAILCHCTRVRVLMLPGWENSYGIGREIELAGEIGIPVLYDQPLETPSPLVEDREVIDDE